MTAAVHCEVRKIAYRQSKDGLVVSFVVHPADMPDALATAPLGQRYMLALAAIGDDEQPIPVPEQKPSAPYRSIAGKERYALSDERERAVTRAGILAGDSHFRDWVAKRGFRGKTFVTDAEAADFIREQCWITSRRELLMDDAAYARFIALETEYGIAIGKIAEPR